MNFSTAEWKARIQDHEKNLWVQSYEFRKATQTEETEFLESNKTLCKSELNNLIDSLENSHLKSSDATLAVLNQIYSDFEKFKKESFTTISNLQYKLTKETKEKHLVEAQLLKTKNALEFLETQYFQELQNSKNLNETLATTETNLTHTQNELSVLKIDKQDVDETVERQNIKITDLNRKFRNVEKELEEAQEVIENLKENQKQRTGPTVDFFKGVRILNVPPCVCDGTQKSMVHLNVSEMVELESVGFLGPLNCDALFQVMLQVNQMTPRGNKWKCVGQVIKTVTARRQQVFHVDFDEPIVLDDYATGSKNAFSNGNGFYSIYFSLKGPDIQSADILNGEDCVEVRQKLDGVVFYTKWYHNHWAELGFQKS